MFMPPFQPSNVSYTSLAIRLLTYTCLTLQDKIVELVFFVTELISVPLLSVCACLLNAWSFANF